MNELSDDLSNELFRLWPTLQRTAADVITPADLRARMAGGRQLRIKYGVDVTAPFLRAQYRTTCP